MAHALTLSDRRDLPASASTYVSSSAFLLTQKHSNFPSSWTDKIGCTGRLWFRARTMQYFCEFLGQFTCSCFHQQYGYLVRLDWRLQHHSEFHILDRQVKCVPWRAERCILLPARMKDLDSRASYVISLFATRQADISQSWYMSSVVHSLYKDTS